MCWRKFVTRNCDSDTGSAVCVRIVVRKILFVAGVNSEVSLGNGSVGVPEHVYLEVQDAPAPPEALPVLPT